MSNVGNELASAIVMVLENDRKSYDKALELTRAVMQQAANWSSGDRYLHVLDKAIGDAIHVWLGENLPRYKGLPQDLIWAQLLGWVAWDEVGRYCRTVKLADLGDPEVPAGWNG